MYLETKISILPPIVSISFLMSYNLVKIFNIRTDVIIGSYHVELFRSFSTLTPFVLWIIFCHDSLGLYCFWIKISYKNFLCKLRSYGQLPSLLNHSLFNAKFQNYYGTNFFLKFKFLALGDFFRKQCYSRMIIKCVCLCMILSK